MRFMVLVKADRNSEAGVMPEERLLAEMGKFNEALVQAGVMQAGEGLHPSSRGARVHFSGKDRKVEHGPFDTPGLIAGSKACTPARAARACISRARTARSSMGRSTRPA
ncbi:hypothetical protein AZ18_1141 [Bordetella bronchiseptica D993]|nr:hypothetical protein AZ18_1141 [Bordetella bronchiseptica D993]